MIWLPQPVSPVQPALCHKCRVHSVRRIVHTDEPSQFTEVPEKSCGHKHGFNYFYRSSLATDGLCDVCSKN